MGTNMTTPTKASVNAFIKAVEHPGRQEDALELLRRFKKVTSAKPVMWGDSIIGFGRYSYKYESGHSGTSFRTGFSPRKANMVIYVMPGYLDLEEPLSRLGPHKMGKSCLYLGRLTKVDLDVLDEIIEYGWDVMAERYPA